MNDIFYASSLTSSPCIIRNEASVKRVTVVVYAIYEQVALTITHHVLVVVYLECTLMEPAAMSPPTNPNYIQQLYEGASSDKNPCNTTMVNHLAICGPGIMHGII